MRKEVNEDCKSHFPYLYQKCLHINRCDLHVKVVAEEDFGNSR